MKRSEFFAEMGKSLLKTVKEAGGPFIEEDLRKLDSFMDELAGIKWMEAGITPSFSKEKCHDLYLDGKPIALIHLDGGKYYAFQKICPSCWAMLQWIGYEEKFKCFSCEKEYGIKTSGQQFPLKTLPVKKENGRLFIGIDSRLRNST